ncbi:MULTISPECIES: PaaX family transcriptional regulator C-terminal domain-containing protein [Streptomyces]|uniref:PaaX family transcriptional regulator C-terminal domain-containing protein n=1 Tax=Streptomyces nondiastaticus TaxID=3154512 RepID=A0ABW6U398_9ACTN|nr:PaaX family transcriptional regulator C-terminal domain-containing protein [Streptomyces sp. VNUA116]WKU43534.1 PaaX family transcriptional regulator C-terminal domain-containing protein [Streptomyces sp. VNUA116]
MSESATDRQSLTGRQGSASVSRGANVPLVPFLYGVAGREELPGVALVRLLADLGLTPAAARSLIARMRRDGLIAATPRGRGADYRLAGTFLESFRQVRHGRPEPPSWDGFFHAVFYTVPEARRAYRDRLRRAASLARYGLMQPGVLISPADRRDHLLAELGGPPEEGTVYFGRVELPTADAAEVAHRAWDLAELDRRYREHTARLTAAVAAQPVPPGPGAAALAAYARLFGGSLTDTLRTPPGLPPELLPDDWPLPALLAAVGRTYAHFGPPVIAYVEEVISESGA